MPEDTTEEAGVVVERESAEDAFELLAHETRVRVLEALSTAEDGLAFSELRAAVGVRDSGQFNYHLGKLEGELIRKREEQYTLSPTGARIVGVILSGTTTKHLEAEPVPMDETCIECGGELELRFEGSNVRVTCLDCGMDGTTIALPPGVLEGWSRPKVPGVVDRWMKVNLEMANYGFCESCAGRMERALLPAGDASAPDVEGESFEAAVWAVYDCSRCTYTWYSMPETVALSDSRVRAFHLERGVDVRETPFWSLEWLSTAESRLADRDPARAEIRGTVAGDELAVEVDDSLDVVAVR